MYGRNDLRASLTTAKATPASDSFQGASYARFYEQDPQQTTDHAKTWLVRGQSMIVAYSEVEQGAEFTRSGQADEYAIVLPEDGCSIEIESDGQTYAMEGRAVAFVPEGDSTVHVKTGGRMLRLFTTRSKDLIELCSNAQDYETPDPNVADFQPWPDPVGGRKVRIYSGSVPPEEGRFGRLYRGSTIMVNFGDGRVGPRAADNLSPHHHDDFEQYSIGLNGDYIHHLRWPWISDSTQWRDDDHERCGTPSVAVIPPPAIHTSQGVDEGLNRLIDAFCPPRMDFSMKPGWVLNAEDYPMPEESASQEDSQ